MNRWQSLGLVGALIVTASSGFPDAPMADTITMSSHTDPAPPLTQAQIDRLRTVTSWDLEFTGEYTLHSSASGGAVPGLAGSTQWTFLEEDSQNFHVRATIAGKSRPSDCASGSLNPCVVQPAAGGRVDVSAFQQQIDSSVRFSTECFPGAPPGHTDTYRLVNRGGGSYLLSTLPKSTSKRPDLEIDYAQNPPILYGEAHFPGAPLHHSFRLDGCFQHRDDEFDFPDSGTLFADWYPESDGYPYGGDSQVRFEHGAFVVRGVSDWTRVASLCVPQFGNGACADPNAPTLAPFTEHYHSEWVLREHDCRDTNGDGNSDDDGDGLCDNWETEGIDADGDGTIDLPLDQAPYNADPEHKDLFVEVDFMDDPAQGHTERPSDGALAMMTRAFARAPVTNPDGLTGVTLHFVGSDAANPDPSKLVDETLPHSDRIAFAEDVVAACPATSFDDLKKSNFGTAAERAADPNGTTILEAKARAFRYAIFAHQQADLDDGNGGCTPTTSSGVAELPGNDLIVTLGGWKPFGSPQVLIGGGTCFTGETPGACAERHADAATFMHEFGHTLGLHHGGADDVNCKPNYLSLMNYSFQFPDTVSSRPLDYSGGRGGDVDDDPFAPLDERSLSEPDGVQGPAGRASVFGLRGRNASLTLDRPVDWNGDPNGRTDETGVVADVARRDANDGCSLGDSVDVDVLTMMPTAGVRSSSVPAPAAFTVHVNGSATETPTAVAIANRRVYLTLPTPATASDSFTLDYVKPAMNPLLDGTGVPYGDANGLVYQNVTRRLKTLFARDDWATLQYDMRLAPAFEDGASRTPQVAPEPTPDDLLASASEADFDGDGISNALDDCPATYDPGQEDLDADGFGDACEPETTEDDLAPASGAAASPPPNGAGWNNADVTVSLTAADEPNGSGVQGIDYVMKGAQAEAARAVAGDTASTVVSAEGETSVRFRAVDEAGNVEPPHAVTVRLDKTPPSIAASQDPPPNGSGWNSGDVTVSYACDDALSGLASCDGPAVVTGEGAGLAATGHATDVAGNAAQVTASLNIDRTPPTVTCSVTPSVLWPPKHKLIKVEATIDVADPLSGPGGFVLTSVTSSEPDSVKRKDLSGDIQEFSVGSPSTEGQLRAERLPKGPGRVYTMTWEGRDAAGNAASCSATVTVPKRKPRAS